MEFPRRSRVVVPPLFLSGCSELRFRTPQSHPVPRRRSSEKKNKRCLEIDLRRTFGDEEISLLERDGDIITKVRSLELRTFTDKEATQLTASDAPHSHIIDDVVDTLFENLSTAPERCAWNIPVKRPEWNNEFRLSREWWLSFCVLPSTAKSDEHYPPFIPWSLRNTDTENQFFADLSLHMRRKQSVFSLLHIDHIKLTPERMSVLLLDGILKNEARALQCLSASFCEIGAATLLLLLCGLNQCRSAQPQLRFLNLPFNWIDSSCLNVLAILLRRTFICRLSLRGNRLGGGEVTDFQEFLLQGCTLLRELDLGYTHLTHADVCALIRCLPQLCCLEVLLLDGIDIPASKVVALSTAIGRSNLTYVSLKGIPACSGTAYLEGVQQACQRNLDAHKSLKHRATMLYLSKTGSFFEAFARRSIRPGGEQDDNNSALPALYRPFVTNEPSLLPTD